MKRGLVILAPAAVALVTSCAAHAPPYAHVAAPSAAMPAASDHELERALATQCGACHDGTEPGRPIFDETHSLDRSAAMRVALAVSAGAMPPPPAELDDGTRRHLIALACTREATGFEPASSCISRLGRPAPDRWLVGTDAILRIADRRAQDAEPGVVFDDKQRAELARLLQVAEVDARAIRLDTSLATMITLYAAARCGDPAVVGDRVYGACVSAVTDYRAWAVPSSRAGGPR